MDALFILMTIFGIVYIIFMFVAWLEDDIHILRTYFIPYILYNLFIKFKQSLKRHKMLNTKALIKALSFLCLPTLSVLLILYFWFLDFGRFTDFVTSQSGWAGVLRVALIIAELCLVYHMYCHYNEIIPNEKANEKLYKSILGQNFKHVTRIDSSNSGKRLTIDYSEAEKLSQIVNPSGSDNYKASIYYCPELPNIAIIKKH